MFIGDTPALKKERQRAAWEYSGKHYWGDKSNAGKNYTAGLNKGKCNPANPIHQA